MYTTRLVNIYFEMECVSVQPLHTAIVTGRALTMGSKPERKRRATGAIYIYC